MVNRSNRSARAQQVAKISRLGVLLLSTPQADPQMEMVSTKRAYGQSKRTACTTRIGASVAHSP